MSGIYGFWNTVNKADLCQNDIIKLSLWNKAYGNVTEESYMQDHFVLGCSYEKVSHMAVKSTPVLRRDGRYAVIDALLYNREELMEKGQFTGAFSDEELLWAYVEKFGMDSLKDINGDFSGAIYDEHENRLTLFRDHMGVRPLFYFADDKCVAFSTDMRGLLAMDMVDSAIDEKWLWSTVVTGEAMRMENTEFAHILCVRPATYIQFSFRDKGLQIDKECYWRLGSKKIRLSSEAAYIEQMRRLITDSVKRRLEVTSGQVGAELSGGLDSGVIDILINRMGRPCTYFSWSMSPEKVPFAKDDERIIIEDICRQEGITCNYGETIWPLGEQSIIAKKMRQIGMEPDMNEGVSRRYVFPPYINTLEISEAGQFVNRSGARVVFTGHGGDEGVSHRCNVYEMFYHKEYYHYLRYMWSTTHGQKHRVYKTLKRCYDNITKTGRELKSPFSSSWTSKDLLKVDFYEKYNNRLGEALTFAYDPIAYIENGGSRNRLEVTALLGAYSGVRYLVPYLDYRVIDYAVSIPRHMYKKKGKNRYIFREAFKDIMPKSLYTVTTKQSNSWSNVVKQPRENQDYVKQKTGLLDMLDRTYWKQYLDFEKIEKWAKKEEQNDKDYDDAMIIQITHCVKAQNVVERSKLVGKTVATDK